MQRFTILALILAASASSAHADEHVSKYSEKFEAYAKLDIDGRSATDCAMDVGDAAAEGVPADAVFAINNETIPFAEIRQRVCAPYEHAVRLAEVTRAVAEAQRMNVWIAQIDMDPSRPENVEMLVTTTKRCMDASSLVAGLGVGGVEVQLERLAVKLGEAKQKVCEPLAKTAKLFAKAKADREAAISAPFRKVGIAGDKLEVCAHHAAIYGIGGSVLTPAQIKKASIVFVLHESSDDTGVSTLQRFIFNGNKLVARTERELAGAPEADAYR